ncbi:MAG: hypothetical protein ACTSYB_16895 [Candidatus Helarchaeota archaeon]
MPKDKSDKEKKKEGGPPEQNIPEEVLQQLPPEVKAQLGYQEKQEPIFKPPSEVNPGLSDSIDRLREGFEKIGLTLIGRMGEFASTLERVVMTVGRIEKVEKSTAETNYFLKNLQKTLEGFKRDFARIVDKIDGMEIDIERITREITELKSKIENVPTTPVNYSRPPVTPPPAVQPGPPVTPPPAVQPEPPATPPPAVQPEPPATPPPISQSTISVTPPLEKSQELNPIEAIFSDLKEQIKSGISSVSIADLLDQAREQISQQSKWTPALYEIGKLARKLRKSNTSLAEKDVIEINDLLDQWKNQIIQS